MALIRLAYASQLHPGVGPRDVDAIVAASVPRNAAAGITGCMSVDEGHVVQILEGEETAVLSLFDRISVDPRHQGVVEFVREPIDRLTFRDWGMRRWAVAEVAALVA